MAGLEEARPDRRYLSDSTHHCLIQSVETIETQEGQELCIFELKLLATHGGVYLTDEPHTRGEEVKQIFALTGVPKWRIESNLRTFKQIIRLTLGIKDANGDQLEGALDGQEESTLAGKYLKVIGRRENSKTTDKVFTKFSYYGLSEEELQEALEAAPKVKVTKAPEAEVTPSPIEEIPLGDDVDPPF